MRISVVILNWNRPADTVKAVDSVLVQDYSDLEIVVWDNASTDDSKAILESRFGRDPRIRLVFADANYGVAGGRNRAFRETAGELVFWLDSDALLEDHHALSIVAERLAGYPDVSALSFEVKRPDGHLMWPFSRPAADWRCREFETMRVDGCSFVVRRRVFEEVGGFAEHFSPYGAEDQHFAFKVIGAGYRVLYFPTVSVVHAFAGHGRSPQQFAMHVRNMLLIPLELFPMPRGLLSVGKLAAGLLRESLGQHQPVAYIKGLFRAVIGFRAANRRVMSREGWTRFRALVFEDKSFAKSILEPGYLRCAASHAWFYARVLMLFLVKAMVRLLILVRPMKKPAIELQALRLCNRVYKTPVNPVSFLSFESLYDTQDTLDFFTLARRLKVDDRWFVGKRLLEIGSGLGKLALVVARKGAQSVHGIDTEADPIEFARRMAGREGITNASFETMSVNDLVFEDESFDGAFSNTVFEHLPDVPRALAEIHRVLKPGGELIFTFDAFRSRHGAHIAHFVGVPWACFFFDPESVTALWTQERDLYLKSRGVSLEKTLLQISEGIGGLNRLKVSEIEAMILRSPFKIIAVEPYGQEAPLLTLFPFLMKMPTVYEYLRGSAVFRLIKTTA